MKLNFLHSKGSENSKAPVTVHQIYQELETKQLIVQISKTWFIGHFRGLFGPCLPIMTFKKTKEAVTLSSIYYSLTSYEKIRKSKEPILKYKGLIQRARVYILEKATGGVL